MNISVAARQKSVSSALGSLRAEGMKPSTSTQKLLKKYASGTISAKELRKQAVASSKKIVK